MKVAKEGFVVMHINLFLNTYYIYSEIANIISGRKGD
jgi:hypothetical protein